MKNEKQSGEVTRQGISNLSALLREALAYKRELFGGLRREEF